MSDPPCPLCGATENVRSDDGGRSHVVTPLGGRDRLEAAAPGAAALDREALLTELFAVAPLCDHATPGVVCPRSYYVAAVIHVIRGGPPPVASFHGSSSDAPVVSALGARAAEPKPPDPHNAPQGGAETAGDGT